MGGQALILLEILIHVFKRCLGFLAIANILRPAASYVSYLDTFSNFQDFLVRGLLSATDIFTCSNKALDF